jgi:hypothetical protein
LDSTDGIKDGLYEESGFAIELLVKKYHKKKLLKLIKLLPDCSTNKLFIKKFKEVYSFTPNYKEFNNLSS